MFFPVLDALNTILLPLAIVVVLLIVIYLVATGRRDRASPPAPPPAPATETPAPAARRGERLDGAGTAVRPVAPPATTPGAPPVASPVTARTPLAAPAQVPPPTARAPQAPMPDAEPAVTAVPAVPPAPAAPQAPTPPLTADLLLVDDSAVARAKLGRLFTGAGYTVQLAKDGVEALALLRQGRYAMLITDLEMPNMDGVELIATLEADPVLQNLPVLAITGHENLQERLGACRGLTGIHRKPWNDEDLRDHVAAVVGDRRTLPSFDELD